MSSLATELADYEAKRKELISKDRSLRLDVLAQDQLSALEIEADGLMRSIRAAEAESVWSADYPSIPHPFPGMEFLTGRSIIVQTEIFKILCKMPKGALLHAHLDATVNASFLYGLGLQEPSIHIQVPQVINAQTLNTALPKFKALPAELHNTEAVSLTSPSYVPDSWISLAQARQQFDPALGGPDGFDRWVLGCLTINPAEAYGTHNTVTKIWQKFTSTFRVADGLIHYVPIFTKYIREFIRSSIEDGILYVEPRVNFWIKTMVNSDGVENVTHRDLLMIFESVLEETIVDLKAQGREDEFVGGKIIYSTLRFLEPDELDWYFEDCIALKKEFPHLIAGFDLVGDENVLYPLSHYTEKLLNFRHMQKDAGVDIPFILHAGETLGDGSKADMNLYDAILLGTKRIGHGFSLVKHPELMNICREKNIALEVCPISNEILRLTSSMPMHPLPILLNYGIAVALCSDDPSVFGNMGLSFDFFQVLVSSEVTGLIQLGAMARDSIKHSMLESHRKEIALEKWHRQWQKFLEYIVSRR
ncbi:hypothetical protein EDD18DRAFT_636779 [Armillaria luteobubalina]|uniref:adenosine deaminase n=1 Tax=Armillaria luteobubalina TaxID=153913 RepID=A0AA39QKZ8_9AGAR|nr:hypothetical protein EDD18DRAFT_636779 [Armillaria luteobubalina]